MAEIQRTPSNMQEIGGAILSVMAYISFYESFAKSYIPGEEPTHFQVALLGLLLLGVIFSLLYLSSIRTLSTSDSYGTRN